MKFTVNPHRIDPYRNFKFSVKWDGQRVPGVTHVSGLTRSTKVVYHREGSDPSLVHVAPGETTFDPITIERGLTHDTAFEDWANLVYSQSSDADSSLKMYRKDITIDIFNLQGVSALAYKLYRCWVCEYQPFTELNSMDGGVAIERLVIRHEGWERDTAVTEPEET